MKNMNIYFYNAESENLEFVGDLKKARNAMKEVWKKYSDDDFTSFILQAAKNGSTAIGIAGYEFSWTE